METAEAGLTYLQSMLQELIQYKTTHQTLTQLYMLFNYSLEKENRFHTDVHLPLVQLIDICDFKRPHTVLVKLCSLTV